MTLRHVLADKLALRLVITAMFLVAVSPQLFAQDNRAVQARLLTAFGTGEVRATPDMAEVQLGVVTEAPNATDARQQNASRAEKVISAISALGIPENAIRTSIFQLEAVRRFEDQNQNQRGEPPIVGYRVTNEVNVRTPKFDLVPRIIDDAIKAGANRVDYVSFILSNEASARQSALREAGADARANAQAMAKGLGVTLGQVQSVQQGGAVVPQPGPVMFRAAEAAVSTPILPGEVTVNATVTVTYQLK